MEEAVYIIRLTRDDASDRKRPFTGLLPSEERYSASFMAGSGCVHIILGLLNVTFGGLALFVEPECNQYGSGLWTGLIFVICGVCGVLSKTRWYVRSQIFYFVLGSFLAMMAALTAVVMTSLGVEMKKNRLNQIRAQYATNPYVISFNEEVESQTTFIVTSNIFITSVLEFFWSLWSFKVAFDGFMTKEYQFGNELQPYVPTRSDSRVNNPRDLAPGQSRYHRKEFHIRAKLPFGSSSESILNNPHFLCNLLAQQPQEDYHITRVNPLCMESSESDVQERIVPFSTLSQEDKVERYLSHSVFLAQADNVWHRDQTEFISSWNSVE
ncbi:hypothetical protein TCAL_14235 [Tigriopus californicus]|uniref:Uncharacterized protein n=1 Tax=Tigriopus californicus TaxID=6832 RepID=A0A553NUV9_TIGCA|nr:uncharacterized protein LOC131886792 [Tigriopus californicus]TRY69210.1 hypothetical protein TCAL_14235 [Tigriopus californicus]